MFPASLRHDLTTTKQFRFWSSIITVTWNNAWKVFKQSLTVGGRDLVSALITRWLSASIHITISRIISLDGTDDHSKTLEVLLLIVENRAKSIHRTITQRSALPRWSANDKLLRNSYFSFLTLAPNYQVSRVYTTCFDTREKRPRMLWVLQNASLTFTLAWTVHFISKMSKLRSVVEKG